MSKVIVFLNLLLASGLLVSALEITPGQKAKWGKALGSQDYEVRVKTMREVWERGEDALS